MLNLHLKRTALVRWASPLVLLLGIAPLPAQEFSFTLQPAEPAPGDTAQLAVAWADAWTPSGHGDTLHIVYTYSDFQLNPESSWSIDSASAWLDDQVWRYDIALDTAARRLSLWLYLPEASSTADPGFLIRLGGLEIQIEEIVLRQARPERASGSLPLVQWRGDRLLVAATDEANLREVWLGDLAGRQLGYWRGEAPALREVVPAGTVTLLVRVRTETADYFFRLMAR